MPANFRHDDKHAAGGDRRWRKVSIVVKIASCRFYSSESRRLRRVSVTVKRSPITRRNLRIITIDTRIPITFTPRILTREIVFSTIYLAAVFIVAFYIGKNSARNQFSDTIRFSR